MNTTALAVLGDSVYVLDFGAEQVLEFDPLTDTITNQVSVPGIGRSLAGITGPDELVANIDDERRLCGSRDGKSLT